MVEAWFLYGGMALCLFSLWAIARHDRLRLTRPMRRGLGEVVGHRIGREDGQATYAPIYRFTAEDGVHEVVDPVFSSRKQPDLGTRRELAWPQGHPELARPPRPLLWAAVYLFLGVLFAVLAAKALGYIPG